MIRLFVVVMIFIASIALDSKVQNHIVHVDDFYIWNSDSYSFKTDNIESKYTELFQTDKLFSKEYPLFSVESPDISFVQLVISYDNYRFVAFYSTTFIAFYRLDVLLMSLTKLNLVYIRNIAKGAYSKYKIQNCIAFTPDLLIAELVLDQSRTIISMQLSYDPSNSEINIKDQVNTLSTFKELAECQPTFKRFTTKLLRYCSNIGNGRIMEYDFDTGKTTLFSELSFDSVPKGIDYKSHEIIIAVYTDIVITYEIPTGQISRVKISPILYSFFETTTNELFLFGVDKVLYSFSTQATRLYEIPFEVTTCKYIGRLITSGLFYCEMPNKSVVFYDVTRPNFVIVNPQTLTFVLLDSLYRGSSTAIMIYKDNKTYYFDKFEMFPTRYLLTFEAKGSNCDYYIKNCWIGRIGIQDETMKFLIYTGDRQRDILIHNYEDSRFHWKFINDKNLLYLSSYFQGFINEVSIFDKDNEPASNESIIGNFYEIRKFKYESYAFDIPYGKILKEKVFLNDNYVINGAIVQDSFNVFAISLTFISREDQVVVAPYKASIESKIDKVLKFQLTKSNTFWVLYKNGKKYGLCLLNIQLSNKCVDKPVFTDPVFDKTLKILNSTSQDGNFNIFFTLKIKADTHQLIRLTSSNMNDFTLTKQEIMLSDSITNIEVVVGSKDMIKLFITWSVGSTSYMSVVENNNNSNSFDSICTFPIAGNQFYLTEKSFLVLNWANASMTFVDLISKSQTVSKIYSPMNFYPLKASKPRVRSITDFIAVILRGDDIDYYGSIDISSKNPYVGFKYFQVTNKLISSRYICYEETCYYSFLQNFQSKRSLFIIRKSFFLHYRLTVESSNYVVQELHSSNILFSFFFQLDTFRDIKFIEKVNVEISNDYIIKTDVPEKNFNLDSNTPAELFLTEMFSGNIMGYHIDFGDNQVTPLKNTGSKFELGTSAMLTAVSFFEPIFLATETHYFQSKGWVVNYEIDDGKFLSLQSTGVITYFVISEARYDILAKLTVSREDHFDFTFCVAISYFGTQILLSCQDIFYYIDVPEDLTKLTNYKEFQVSLVQILSQINSELIKTTEGDHEERKFISTDPGIALPIANPLTDYQGINNQQKLNYKHLSNLYGLANFGLSIKNSILFEDNMLMLYKDETLTVSVFRENKFIVILKYDVPCKVCKFINLKSFSTKEAHIILVTFDFEIYILAIRNQKLLSSVNISFTDPLINLLLNKFDQLELIAISNKEAQIIDVRIIKEKLVYTFMLKSAFKMLSDYQILDGLFLQNTFIFMTVQNAKQRLILSAHDSKGTLKSAIEYESFNLGNFAILHFENNMLYLASQFNFVSIIKVNWDFSLYFLPYPQNMHEMAFDIIAYNPFYALKVKTQIIFSASNSVSVLMAWLYQYYSLEIAMTLASVTLIGYYLSR